MNFTLALNVLFAWISVGLAFLAAVIWFLRILIKKKVIKAQSFFGRANRSLRVAHIGIGVSFVITSILHAIFSSEDLISLNYGSLVVALAFLLAIMILIKNKVQRKAWLLVHRTLTVMLIVFLGIHIYDIGGIPATKQLVAELSGNQEVPEISEQLLLLADEMTTDEYGDTVLKDGVYTGVADGYEQDLTVEVTIADGLICAIDIVSHHEVGPRFYEEAMQVIPEAIIENQSVMCDTITGSTFTSVGIKNAVADALSQAIISGEAPALVELPEETERHGTGEGGGNRRRHSRDEENLEDIE